MKYSLGISDFLEEVSSLSHSIVFLSLCIDHWGRLSSLSLLFFRTLHSNGYIFPFLLCLSLFFPQWFIWCHFIFPLDYLWSSWWFSNREYSLDSSCKPHTHTHMRTHTGLDWGSSQCSSAFITHLSLWHIRGRQELYILLSPYPFFPETSYQAHQRKKYYTSVQGHALSTHSIRLEESLMGVREE